jgi:predicted metal-dependent enzyme (double-stranded beta helix superfamily)
MVLTDLVIALSAEPASGPNVGRRRRDILRDGLRDTALLSDIVRRSLATLDVPFETWRNPPLLVDSERGCSVSLLVWPPGAWVAPHCHTTWTLTGILANQLVSTTFTDGVDGLQVDRRFDGRVGDCGFIDPPCIHNIANTTGRTSLSVHVFSFEPYDRRELSQIEAENTRWYGENRAFPVRKTEILAALLSVLERCADSAGDLLMSFVECADLRTGREAVRLLGRRNADQAARAGQRIIERYQLLKDGG